MSAQLISGMKVDAERIGAGYGAAKAAGRMVV